MTAVSLDLYMEQGATFDWGFVYCQEALDDQGNAIEGEPGDPYDLTGCSARMQIRQKKGSPVLVDATTEDGRIKIGGTNGRIDIELTDLDTNALNIKKAVYDLELVWPLREDQERPTVDRLLQGTVNVSLNITEGDET